MTHTVFHRTYYAVRRVWNRWRNPRLRRFLLHVVYRNYQEQYKRVLVTNAVMTRIRDVVFDHENVRAMRVYEEHFYGHKSFTDEFDTSIEAATAFLKSHAPIILSDDTTLAKSEDDEDWDCYRGP